MAEVVGIHQERTIPEYEMIRKHHIFSEDRIRVIIKTRENYKYKLSKSCKSLKEFGSYIVYEKKLHEMVQIVEHSRNEKFPGLTSSMANRIVRLYREALRIYPDENRLWDAYIRFCKKNFPSELPNAYENLIQKKGDRAKVWNSAAMYFHENGNNIEKVKNIFFRGLQRHPDSELLFTSFFHVLLTESATLPKELQQASLERVIAIYNTAKKKIGNIKFLLNLLQQCDEALYCVFTKPLQKLIVRDMMLLYPRVEEVWDILARRELAGESISDCLEEMLVVFEPEESKDEKMDDKDEIKEPLTVPKPTLKSRIESCFNVYQTAVGVLKTQEMWSFFVRAMIELNVDLSTQAVLKRKKLASAFRGAYENNFMTEEHYIAYINLLSESKSNGDFILKIMNEATTRYNSPKLWEQRLAFHIMDDDRVKVYEIFRMGVHVLGANSYPLWKLVIQYLMTCCYEKSTKLQEIFKEACAYKAPQFLTFRPQFLEWSVVNQPFAATRALYEELKMLTPPSLELHQKMVLLESQALKPDIEKIRYCYENALFDFGKTRTDVWIDFIKFEREDGEPKRVSSICERAKMTLDPVYVDNFITEHCLFTVGTSAT